MLTSCLICIVVIVVTCFGVYFFSGQYLFPTDSEYVHIIVDPNREIFKTDEQFLSVALDTSFMACLFHKLDERDWLMLEEFSRLLSPAYLRLGGTSADQVIFVSNGNVSQALENCDNIPPNQDIVITGKDWIKLNNFAKKSGFKLIMDLNVLIRSDSKWNSSNAESLIKFSEENELLLDFQLGNEPNSFPHVFNRTISGSQLAQDYYQLRKLLNSYNFYKSSKLIGPEVTRPKHLETSSLKYLREFLGKESTINVVSWHQYYLNGKTATVEDFLNPETLNVLPTQIEAIIKVVQESSKQLPIWISETSSAYGDGAPNLSNRFAASFLWLDKLGMAAKMGMSVVIRQSLYKGNYALINMNFTPAPDFWISFFYKNLVGRQVFDIKNLGDEKNSKYLRFYCHCLSPNSKINGNLVIFGMNLSNDTKQFVTSGLNINYPIYSFVFQPELNRVRAKSVLLNGNKLVYNQSTIYDLLNNATEVQFPLSFPPYSIGYWVFNEIDVKVCNR